MREEKRILNVLGQVDGRYIEEAAHKTAGKKPVRIKWAAVAACLVFAAVLSVGALRGGWFSGSDTARLDNGAELNFVKCDAVGGAPSLDYDAASRELSEEETGELFGDLPVAANAVFSAADGRLIGFEGKIGDIKMIIATAGLPLLDTAIVGGEKTTEVDGVPVTAGYFLTDPNSRGERTAIYFAAFELGGSRFYVENAGAAAERETVKNDLAAAVQKLIANGEPDITRF